MCKHQLHVSDVCWLITGLSPISTGICWCVLTKCVAISSLIFESVDIRLGWGTSLPSHSAPWWGYILCSSHVCLGIIMLELHKGAMNTKVLADFIRGSWSFDGELNLLHLLSSRQLLTSHGTGYWLTEECRDCCHCLPPCIFARP